MQCLSWQPQTDCRDVVLGAEARCPSIWWFWVGLGLALVSGGGTRYYRKRKRKAASK